MFKLYVTGPWQIYIFMYILNKNLRKFWRVHEHIMCQLPNSVFEAGQKKGHDKRSISKSFLFVSVCAKYDSVQIVNHQRDWLA